jgi:hypothetical protein
MSRDEVYGAKARSSRSTTRNSASPFVHSRSPKLSLRTDTHRPTLSPHPSHEPRPPASTSSNIPAFSSQSPFSLALLAYFWFRLAPSSKIITLKYAGRFDNAGSQVVAYRGRINGSTLLQATISLFCQRSGHCMEMGEGMLKVRSSILYRSRL